MYYSQLGFDNYDEYLNGNNWKEIHEMFYLSGGPYRCTICHARKALLLHKRSYAFLNKEFFRELIAKRNIKLLRKILSWKCNRCNSLVHFYDRKLTQKVPLDYLFLMERETRIHRRPDMFFRRFFRTIVRIIRWFKESYRIAKRRKKFY